MNEYQSNEPFVLGQQSADALSQEQARLKAGNPPPSPFPNGEYEARPGECELLNPAPSDLDTQIRKACKTFSSLPQNERRKFTASISMDEFYRLITFARRSAVFALRGKDADLLQDALSALAMIETKRTDFRDVVWVLALLHHTAAQIGLDADSLIRRTSQLAEPETAKLFSDFTSGSARHKSLRDSWGYLEVETQFGRGFVRCGFRPYAPRTDLLRIAIKIASILDTDSYRTDSIEIATELPDVWLKTSDPSPLKEALSKVLGGATINARLLAEKHAAAHAQQFTIFLVETDSPETTSVLLKLSQAKRPKDLSMLGVMLGVAVERVFSLVIARSFVQGTDAFENGDSLNRFQKQIQRAISSV
jgi:hypothetical protein